MKLVTAKQMREIERIAMEEIGIPSILLMENAATAAAQHCLDYLSEKIRKVIIAAGPGNNGGDGFALARRLFFSGTDVRVIFVGDFSGLKGDALINAKIAQNLGIPVEHAGDERFDISEAIKSCDLVVDALFGTGLARPLTGEFEYVVETINLCASHIISLDMPSGIHTDTGQVMGTAVQAHKTVTFSSPKQGLYLFPGTGYTGEIAIAPIGIPDTIVDRLNPDMETAGEEEIQLLLPARFFRSHKGSYGRVYVMSGNKEMTGAAVLSATAAYKAGAGLVKVCATAAVVSVIQAALPEAITTILPDENGFLCKRSGDCIKEDLALADVLVLGPGLGWNDSTRGFVLEILPDIKSPLILDADALNIVAEDVNLLKMLKTIAVVTPHPGEMSRLTGRPVKDILKNAVEAARDFAKRFHVVTVLKDARTVVAAPDGAVYLNTTGTDALAKAGSGDVLSGLIGAFIAQGLDAFTAAKLACYLHGDAGRLAEKSLSRYGVTATDLLRNIPLVLKKYQGLM